MIHAEELPKNQLQLAPVVLTVMGERAKDTVVERNRAAREQVGNPSEISLSVSHVLLVAAVAMGSITLFIWALVKLWLFGR